MYSIYKYFPGKKMPVVLGFLLRLHLIDENDDELIVTVSADDGVELLGEWSFYKFTTPHVLRFKS
jgi:hypothetical protein